jgi:hypothetical protein
MQGGAILPISQIVAGKKERSVAVRKARTFANRALLKDACTGYN